MNLRGVTAEADRLLVTPDISGDFATIEQFLIAASGSLVENIEFRTKSTKVALRAARQMLDRGHFPDSIRIILLGRQLAQNSSEIIDLEICAIEAFLNGGDRVLALEKLKLLNKRQSEMNKGQLEELAKLRPCILQGGSDTA